MISSCAPPLPLELLAEVRSQTCCPCGDWIYFRGNVKNSFHVFSDTSRPGAPPRLEECIRSGRFAGEVHGQLVAAAEAWHWCVDLYRGDIYCATRYLHFQENGTMRSTTCFADAKLCSSIVGDAVNGSAVRRTSEWANAMHAVHSTIVDDAASGGATSHGFDPVKAGATIVRAVGEILSVYGVPDRELAQSTNALHGIFELLDRYNKRLKAVTGKENPFLHPVVECLARSTALMMRSSERPSINVTVLAASMLYRLGRLGPDEALSECQELFNGALLDWAAAPLRASLKALARVHLEELQDLLEALVHIEAAKEVDHAGLLQLAGAIAARLKQPLPLQAWDTASWTGSALPQPGQKLTLEYLISQCHRQYSTDEDRFLQQVAPRFADAAAAGTAADEEAAQRLAHCARYAVQCRGQLRSNEAVREMAVASCSTSPSLLGQVVVELCRARPPVLNPSPKNGAFGDESFAREVLWPLMEQDLPTEHVQKLLVLMVQKQIARGWEAGRILSVLQSVVEQGSGRWQRAAWHKLAHVALTSGAQSCGSNKAAFARQMFCALNGNSWLGPDDLCGLCSDLAVAMGAENRNQLPAAAWKPLLGKCCGRPAPQALDAWKEVTELNARYEHCLKKLSRHAQLFGWLLGKWHLQELQPQLAAVEELQRIAEQLALAELERRIAEQVAVFRRFDELPEGGHLATFLQHFVQAGSCLIGPLQEHFASELEERHRPTGSTRSTTVVWMCYRALQGLALGGEVGAAGVSIQVWEAVVKESLKSGGGMRREFDLLYDYFGPFRADSRRVMLEDAFRLHTVVALLPCMVQALQQMSLNWILDTDAFARARDVAGEVARATRVNADDDSALMKELEHRLGLPPGLDPGLFPVLLEKMCIVDFLVEKGVHEAGGLARLRRVVNTIRGILEALVGCADALEPLPQARAAFPDEGQDASKQLREMLLAVGHRSVRLEAFSTVAENIGLLKAIFDKAAGISAQAMGSWPPPLLGCSEHDGTVSLAAGPAADRDGSESSARLALRVRAAIGVQRAWRCHLAARLGADTASAVPPPVSDCRPREDCVRAVSRVHAATSFQRANSSSLADGCGRWPELEGADEIESSSGSALHVAELALACADWPESDCANEVGSHSGHSSNGDDEVESASGQSWEVVRLYTSSGSWQSIASASQPGSPHCGAATASGHTGRKNEVDRFLLEVADVQNLDVEGRRPPLPSFEPIPGKKCSESFLEGAKLFMPEELVEGACSACKSILKSMAQQASTLELPELFAILLFLCDVRLLNPATPASAGFYPRLRHAVREREQAVLVPLNNYLCHLQKGLKKLPLVDGPVYCGVPAEASRALADLEEGQKVGWSTFISLTPLLRVAQDAAGPEGTILGVECRTARNLSSINEKADPSQRREVVLLPGTRLTVGNKERSDATWLLWLHEPDADKAEDSDDIDV